MELYNGLSVSGLFFNFIGVAGGLVNRQNNSVTIVTD